MASLHASNESAELSDVACRHNAPDDPHIHGLGTPGLVLAPFARRGPIPVAGEKESLSNGFPARTRTWNSRTKTCCVTNYTTGKASPRRHVHFTARQDRAATLRTQPQDIPPPGSHLACGHRRTKKQGRNPGPAAKSLTVRVRMRPSAVHARTSQKKSSGFSSGATFSSTAGGVTASGATFSSTAGGATASGATSPALGWACTG